MIQLWDWGIRGSMNDCAINSWYSEALILVTELNHGYLVDMDGLMTVTELA